jgi:hypothetical protein
LTASKLFANIFKNEPNRYSEIFLEQQCIFRKGRSLMDAIFTVQQVVDKEHNSVFQGMFY